MQISQAAISTLYALLNEITRYSDEDGATADRYSMLTKNAISGAPDANQLSEKQKQQVCANALSAIVGVAVYLKDEAVSIISYTMNLFLISFKKIMAQALSMLTMRRKSLSISATASLTSRLVDLALVSPIGVFKDILNLFSTLSREALTIDNKQLTTAVRHITQQLRVENSCMIL